MTYIIKQYTVIHDYMTLKNMGSDRINTCLDDADAKLPSIPTARLMTITSGEVFDGLLKDFTMGFSPSSTVFLRL